MMTLYGGIQESWKSRSYSSVWQYGCERLVAELKWIVVTRLCGGFRY